jgi:hypothetical protein
MAFTSIGCISASQVFATQSWPAGTKQIGPVALPDKFSHGQLLVDLTQVTDLLATMTVNIQMSNDGVTFFDVFGFGLSLPNSGYTLGAGGGVLDSSGNPIRIVAGGMKFPPSILTTRQVQGTIVLDNPATIGMTVVIY